MFGVKALTGLLALLKTRAPLTQDVIRRAGRVVKSEDSRMVNMSENSEGA